MSRLETTQMQKISEWSIIFKLMSQCNKPTITSYIFSSSQLQTVE